MTTVLDRYALDVEYEWRRRQKAKERVLTEYQRDPLGFCVNILHIAPETLDWSLLPEYAGHQWDHDPAGGNAENPIKAMLDALAAGHDVGVEAGTGTQKSYTAAAIILWFLGCWRDSRVFTFAPKEDQLRLYIWTEMRKLFPAFQMQFPNATLTDLCLRMRGGIDDSWAARGYPVGVGADAEVAVKAAGMHAEHMLLIYEETPGIPKAVLEAGENTVTGPHNMRLYLGNPDNQFDTLHHACLSPGVVHIRISALDHPNVVTGRQVVPGGAVSRQSVEARLAKYGRTHRLYQSRVRGISPTEAKDALIKLEWIQKSVMRWAAATDRSVALMPLALGVDVANSEDGDEGAKARMRGHRVLSITSFPCPNANDLGIEVGRDITRDKIDPRHVGIDSVGVGAGTVNELRKRNEWWGVQALNGGESPRELDWDAEEYNNLRSQIHWCLAEDFRLGQIDIPNDRELIEDLITPTYQTRNGKIVIESKEEIKRRLPSGRSPNKADALAYANFVRDREPVAKKADTVIPENRSAVSWKTGREPKGQSVMDEPPPAPRVRYAPLRREGEISWTESL